MPKIPDAITIAELPETNDCSGVITEASLLLAGFGIEDPEIIADEMAAGRTLLAIDTGARVVGACVVILKELAYIEYLGVEETRRGKGIGSYLIGVAETMAREYGGRGIDLIYHDELLGRYFRGLGYVSVTLGVGEGYRAIKFFQGDPAFEC